MVNPTIVEVAKELEEKVDFLESFNMRVVRATLEMKQDQGCTLSITCTDGKMTPIDYEAVAANLILEPGKEIAVDPNWV